MGNIKLSSVGVVIKNLSLSFGNTRVLNNIDLSIEPGEFFSFLGPSGSGKSTLLRAIAGFGPQPKGEIFIGGEEISHLPPWKRRVGMVFQSYALWPHMSVRKNVAFGLEEHKVPAKEIPRRVDEALEMVGLLELAERRPSQLSGGQQQRIALARTTVVKPQVLLLDEPLSNLDANLRVQMRQEIHALQKSLGITTIFVTHDQEEANALSHRMALLNNGAIQQVDSPTSLYDDPKSLFVAVFLGAANVLRGRIEKKAGKSAMYLPSGLTIPLNTSLQGEHSLVFRPQNVLPESAVDKPPTGSIRLAGEVVLADFLGGNHRYTVRLAADQVIQVDTSHQRGFAGHQVGDNLKLYVPESQCVLLAAE